MCAHMHLHMYEHMYVGFHLVHSRRQAAVVHRRLALTVPSMSSLLFCFFLFGVSPRFAGLGFPGFPGSWVLVFLFFSVWRSPGLAFLGQFSSGFLSSAYIENPSMTQCRVTCAMYAELCWVVLQRVVLRVHFDLSHGTHPCPSVIPSILANLHRHLHQMQQSV